MLDMLNKCQDHMVDLANLHLHPEPDHFPIAEHRLGMSTCSLLGFPLLEGSTRSSSVTSSHAPEGEDLGATHRALLSSPFLILH